MKAITLHGPGDVRVESMKGYAIFDRKEDRAIKVMLKP